MVRKMMIALAATAFVGAIVVSSTADARSGGGFGGGGFRGGGMHMGGGGFRGGGMHMGGGGFRGAHFGGGGFRSAHFGGGFRGAHFGGFRGGFVRPGFRHGFVGNRFAFRHHRRFFAAPFFVGASLYPAYAYSSYYDDPCWVVRYTPWGPRTVYVCDYY
ncbi:MAG: hypothetical protein ACJ8D9_11615 [Xanthobacteraceae bacterium]